MTTHPKVPPFSLVEVEEHLSYSTDTGEFTWLKGPRRGKLAGSITLTGYSEIKVLGHKVLAHRLAWFIVYGEWPKRLIDHIDRNRRNNAIANLREANHSQNYWNTTIANNGEPIKGYTFLAKKGRYEAQIRANGSKFSLGLFDTPEEARSAYLAAKRKLHGEFFPMEWGNE